MMVRVAMAILGSVMLAGCSVFGVRSGTEQVGYEVVDRLGAETEIRQYPPRLVAETVVTAGDEESGRSLAFRALFDYISGDNRAQAKVAMTTPVETASGPETVAMTAPVETAAAGAGRTAMRFYLPAGYTLETAPVPRNPAVTIVEVPGRTLAVRQFTGSTGAAAVAGNTAALKETLAGSRWQPAGEAVAMFYDPPWTLPFLRRNEVAIPVSGG